MQAEVKDGNLVITLPMNKQPVPSSTGKSLIVASSGGNVVTGVMIDGKPLKIGVNAFLDNR